jgi:hypothetical protein
MTPELTKRLLNGFFDAVRNTLRGGGERGGGDDDDRDPEAVYLAAFGKHPGWDDHVDDMGLETALLVWVKRLLYLQGIAGNIDSGAWEQLPAPDRLDGFDHGFIWKTGGALIVGRLWSSTDGKGRARYPMVVAAQCTGLSPAWVLANVPGKLEALRQGCVATRAAATVRGLVDRTRDELRAAAASAPTHAAGGGGGTPNGAGVIECLATSPEMGADHRGLLSVLYEVEYEMGPYRPGAIDQQGAGKAAPSHVRVPVCVPAPFDAMYQWIEFLGMKLDPAAPILAIHPLKEAWVDLTVGEPSARELFTFRASRKTVPYTTDIPYRMTPAFIRQAEAFIARHRKNGR